MKTFAILAAALFLGLGQDQPPKTTFRSAVDLVPVDVAVLDKAGRPVADLAAENFSLTVDGRPRRVASAQFLSAGRTVDGVAPGRLEYSSNADAAGGRLVMLVADAGNIAVGGGRVAIQSAQRFVEGLNAADRVALATIPPGPGPQVDFTSDRALVQRLLGTVQGQLASRIGPQPVGLSEALAFERGDQATIVSVMDRECGANPSRMPLDGCSQRLAGEASQILSEARERSRNSLLALRRLFDRVGATAAPKAIVLLSEGLLLDRQDNDVELVSAQAATSHIVLYVLQLDPLEGDVSSLSVSPSRAADRELMKRGLEQLAAMARGDVFRAVGNPDSIFQRLALELSGSYLLSFEPEPGDRNGLPHKIRIDVDRKDLVVRSRREFSVGRSVWRPASETAAETLRSPLLATEIPVKLTSYTFQDPDSPRLKILLAAEISRSTDMNADLSLAWAMLDDKGRVVSSRVEKSLSASVDRRTRTQKYIATALVGPGDYTIKLAVADDAGKRGSVERSFGARINALGQLHVTDLLIGDTAARTADGVPPTVAAEFTGTELHGYVELFSDGPEQLRNATVAIEVARSEAGPAVAGVPARFEPIAEANRRAAQATVPIALLPAGEYVARAVVSQDGRTLGQVVRAFRIANSPTGDPAAHPTPVPLKPSPTIPVTSKIDAFDSRAVLTPQVLTFFLDRMSPAAAADAAALRPAIESLKEGRFDEAGKAVAGHAQAAGAFIDGILLLQRGDADAASAKFKDALRMDSEFYSAAFYLGVCFAATGQDRQAVGAWQTSLITESSAPFVYTLLGDALLRLRDMDGAIDILVEARTLWPADDEVAQRLGTAYVLARKPGEALRILQPYLDRHPADTERLFLALRALYDARVAGRAIATADADKALFRRYADAYAAAGGSGQAQVEQWRKFIERQPF